MDINQPTTPPVSPVQEPTNVQVSVKSSPNMLLIVVLLIMVVAIAAGAYFFMTNQRTSQSASGITPKREQATRPTSSTNLEDEANAIDVESNDSDFADVDKDLQSL